MNPLEATADDDEPSEAVVYGCCRSGFAGPCDCAGLLGLVLKQWLTCLLFGPCWCVSMVSGSPCVPANVWLNVAVAVSVVLAQGAVAWPGSIGITWLP